MTVEIRLAEDQGEIGTCVALRRAVFIEEQGVTEADEVDGLDTDCQHVLAMEGAVPVGAARFRQIGDTVKIQRVCVIAPARGRRIGARIITFIVEHAGQTTDATNARLGAQIQALDFYRKLGFREQGPQYMDAGIAHRDMIRKL